MNTQESRADAPPGRVILDVEGARDVGPTEAAGLIRECLALTYKRFDGAAWRALDELESAAADEAEASRASATAETPEVKVARAVRRERSKFFPRFRSEFDQLFQARRAGAPRSRAQRGGSGAALALVDEGDHAGQVALKSAIHAMRVATGEEGFGFDLRTRMVLREAPSSVEFSNPWGAELLCDALGNTCRALWAKDGEWRPVMEHLVRALTPELVALHRELDQLLQDRDVLPVLRVRTRKRGDGGASARAVASPDPTEPTGAGDLYRQVVDLFARAPPAAAPWTPPVVTHFQSVDVAPSADPLDFGDPNAWRAHPGNNFGGAPATAAGPSPWQTLQRALDLLERQPAPTATTPGLPAVEPTAPREDAGSVLPALEAAIAASGGQPLDRVTVEIIAAVLDEVFENPYLPPEVKAVFGRLQIPILKAALLDPEVLSSPRHGVRKFFDTLAAASVGVRPEVPHDALFLALAGHLATVIREQLSDSTEVFATARDELETFLDAERAAYNQKLAQALPSLTALDEDAYARDRARTALSVRFASRTLPPEIRDYLDHEGVARLAAAYQRGGPDSAAWRQELELFDELVWSIAPDQAPGTRNRLLQLVPRLVRSLSEGWPADEPTRARRKVFLARLYELHVEALNAPVDLPPAEEETDAPQSAASAAPERPAAPTRDEPVEAMETLQRGDWCEFEADAGAAPLLAKFAWRSPHGTQLLFTHRDGGIALIHTPESLARAFRGGHAKVAVEAVPLFERAMERIIERDGASDAA